ncbi:MAG: DUF2157 domain-containing protein [Alphaproteobacteria bacterium]|nr:DUF2157 domain-containing protein [Alphaproteobacteria bacterium]MBP7762243.1 DUF2157 domain-containing protein [Alphaproteobacteria bacterium]MBP7904180.1 DUF2157 domain-containing protein [Alphaproteobacteria bacterium]
MEQPSRSSPEIAKAAALEQIALLARTHHLSLDEIGAHLTKTALKDRSSAWLSRLLGYIGAVFVFGGLALYMGMIWNDLNSPARVIITFGPGIAAFILGIVTLKDERFMRASTPLFLKAAILQPVGMFVFLDEYASGDDTQLAAMVVFGILAVQFLLCFLIFRRTTLLFFGYLFWNASVGILMDRCEVPEDPMGIGLSLSILMVAWSIDRTKHKPIAAFWYFVGGVGLLWSVFQSVENSAYDIIMLPVMIGLMWVSVRMHSRTMLLVGTFGLLGFLTYYTDQYFKDITGWPLALMMMGFMLVGISYMAVRLSQKIKSEASP